MGKGLGITPAHITESWNIHTVVTASKYPALHLFAPQDPSKESNKPCLTQVPISSEVLPPPNVKYFFGTTDRTEGTRG